MTLKDVGNHWQLAVEHAVVERCCFDYAVVLYLTGQWELRIEQKFFISTSSGQEQSMIPEDLVHTAPHVILLLGAEFREGYAYKDGQLELYLAGDKAVRVPPHDDFEAWELTGPDEVRVVSSPGGDLAVWK